MTVKNTRNGKLLYHLTKFENLKSIIENGLMSRKILIKSRNEFQDNEGFRKINWDLIYIKCDEDKVVKEAKMVEYLADLIIPIENFQSISVKDENVKIKVLELFEEYEIFKEDIFVNIRSTCF